MTPSHSRDRGRLLVSISIFVLLAVAGQGAVQGTEVDAEMQNQPPAETVVIELFTSQGCSSCPPADALLKRLAAERQLSGRSVVALSFHVDYWNYLGWRDPFSSPDWSNRQRHYAEVLPGGRLFTPQVVINGQAVVGGWDEAAIRQEVSRQPPVAGLTIADVGRDPLELTVVQPDLERPAVLFYAVVESGFETPVSSGENAHRALVNDRVVLGGDEVEVEPGKKGAALRLTVEKTARRPGQDAEVVALIRDLETRRVLFAGSRQLPASD